ncbi:MAG: cytochrome ubiquinol oxidase subunit I [Proteobacteria bacterium]|nr:cytochrome ubiquinol oxidase subunit I [Pseudomonadota bacterium]MBU1386311.1 cytochrome ubiquinol oxidase subunit I [Pseudomonadota bacterium]MBU1543941.1 cytochrome ubiquinol oxidase subunit I [Pseudomonadota bacterium]MBU2482262.1 cytochrome ubiquinol oxidase subunit I [Pseudomonadota bacterium]
MDPVFLSRLQFAAATMFHFLFVPLTLGITIIIAYMETKYARTGDKIYLQMTKFWGKLFLINFALGVVTGITLEFQFGTNWSRYSEFVGDVFGSLLAIEASVAFFLESTFIGIWIFGWKRLSAKAHAGVMWVIAFASNLSGVWILTANGFMQHPVGYTIRNGRAELTDFFAVLFNYHGILQIFHTLPSGLLLASFVIMGISAYHLLKKQHVEVFTRSFKIALVFGVICSIFVAIIGDLHGVNAAKNQPAKLAAMEAHWETQTRAPIVLFAIPDEKNERNSIEIGSIPGILSFLGFHDFNATVVGLKDIPKDERPPVLPVFIGFRLMVGIGTVLILLSLYGLTRRNKLLESPSYLKLMVLAIPLPYIAMEMGWVVAEVGRQPWIVYGVLRTAQAASPIEGIQVLISLIGFIAVYGLLGAIGFYLMAKHVKQGPAGSTI